MKNRRIILVCIVLCTLFVASGKTIEEKYDSFRKEVAKLHTDFHRKCNDKYIAFLSSAWNWYDGESPMPAPVEESPVSPIPYMGDENSEPVSIVPEITPPIEELPQPRPLAPIKELPSEEEPFTIDFYGVNCNVRLPKSAKLELSDCKPQLIADGWERLCDNSMNNAIRDCLETRIRYNLCDWAYLSFLDQLCRKFCSDSNGATLLTAFLYCQSGYQMRLGVDSGKLIMLYGSRHQIYDKKYFTIDGSQFYPWGDSTNSLSICNAVYDGETPLSLRISKELVLGKELTQERTIKSEPSYSISVCSRVPKNLIEFYNSYPASAVDGNPMTRWAMYANTPLSNDTKKELYPALRDLIKDCDEAESVNKLLNWVQTGFDYEYDSKVWGYDRAFFAEETLYYPYCDCEDRSILFSRLVRDLVGLDVALIYYPGHLATAVCFNENVNGTSMTIDRRKFTVCDPTYIGAPVGVQMPNLECDKVRALLLER